MGPCGSVANKEKVSVGLCVSVAKKNSRRPSAIVCGLRNLSKLAAKPISPRCP